jgi:DNA-binding LacI/PurR family transcriptional regulator
VTAIFSANDQMALGVLRAMHEAGRRIPEEISIVGFDDIPEAQYLIPPLTTVRQDFAEIGARALLVLMRAIEAHRGHTTAPGGSLVAPELIIRASAMAYAPTASEEVDTRPM